MRIAVLVTAALACAREAVPPELIGSWRSDHPRYADRSLEIGTQWIGFGVVAGARETYRMRGIERESDAEEQTFYRLYYDAPGEPERELQVRVPAPDQLHIENHGELWTRASVVTGG